MGENLKTTSLVGAVGCAPKCFTKEVVESMVKTNPGFRPGIYALSNPKTQAEISSVGCWTWSNGEAIYGSGTGMESLELNGKTFCPGQVNNVYIFPGTSMGAICCQAKTIPERLFQIEFSLCYHLCQHRHCRVRVFSHSTALDGECAFLEASVGFIVQLFLGFLQLPSGVAPCHGFESECQTPTTSFMASSLAGSHVLMKSCAMGKPQTSDLGQHSHEFDPHAMSAAANS